MIILPAIPAIVAALTPLAKAALVSAGIGAAVGGATCAVGSAVSGFHEHGEMNRNVAISTARQAAECAGEGALFGAVIGPVAPMIAPAIAPATQFVDDLAAPVVGALDDVAKSAVPHIDDAAAVAGSAVIVDDAASPFLSRLKNVAKTTAEKVGNVVTSPWRKWRESQNVKNALNYRELPRTYSKGNEGYVYVMDDVSTPGRYKIGKTTQPVERLGNVRSETGLRLDYTCIIGTDNMKSLEDKLFEEFKPQRRPNMVEGTTEIFLLNAAQVASACSK